MEDLLQTSVERLEGDRVKLTVTVPAADVDAAIAHAYAEVARSVRIPGFRQGKAPRPMVDSFVGRDTVLAEAQESVISDAYGRAISAEALRPVEQPDLGELDMVEGGCDFTFTAEVELRPELKLSSLEGLTVELPRAVSSDREIDAQIEHVRERHAVLETVERGLEHGDFALLSFIGTVDGEEYEGNQVDGYLYETGQGLMPEEFDAALVGVSAGDSVVAEFPIPETSSSPEFVGKAARFEITVSEVKAKVLPALDDEFATTVGGFDSLDEYRADVRAKLDKSKAVGRERRLEIVALEALAERLEGEPSEAMIMARANTMTRDFFEGLEERGLDFEGYVAATGVEPDQIQADIKVQATKRVREELALEALFRARGMEVLPEDVDETILGLVGGDVDAVDDMRKRLDESGTLPLIHEQLTHTRAIDWLLANVEIVEKEPVRPGDAPAEADTKKKPRRKKKDDAEAEKE